MFRREGFSPVHADQGDFGRAMGFVARTSERLRMRKKGGDVLVEALTESEAFVGTVQWLTREQYA